MKTALLSGSRGQDCSYLSDLLIEKGYRVVAFERRVGNPDYTNIKHLFKQDNYVLEHGDVTDVSSIMRLLKTYRPDEFYNLAAQSHVHASWEQSLSTCQINFNGVANCLEAIRLVSPNTRFYQASTSEVYGDVQNSVQDENTPIRPRSPYGAAKAGAEHLVKVYRESYGLFACYGRLFNHESPRRGKNFVTRKITSWIGESFKTIKANLETTVPKGFCGHITIENTMNMALEKGLIHKLSLGNIEAQRDWSDARDMVRGMHMMLQQDNPDDYVLASGTTRTVREFLSSAFGVLDINNWDKFIHIDPKFVRPAEVNLLCGNASKAREKLGWKPNISFDQMVKDMVRTDSGLM